MIAILRQYCRIFLLTASTLWLGCGSSELLARIHYLEAQVSEMNFRSRDLERKLGFGFSIALCSPNLRNLLNDVQKECETSGAYCTSEQIRGAVLDADPSHQGRLLKLMSTLPHEVVYFRGEVDRSIAPLRQVRINNLIKLPLLFNTRFIILASPEFGNDAKRKAMIVGEQLIQGGISPKSISYWIHNFLARRDNIEQVDDLPGIGEQRDLNRGVWVFRVDC